MATLSSLTPPDGSVNVGANAPFVAVLQAPAGSKDHAIIETTQADWAAGALTDVVAVTPGNLELASDHADDFESYPTGSFPTSGWTNLGPGSGSVTVENTGASKALRINATSSSASVDRIRWDTPSTGADVNAYVEWMIPTSMTGRTAGLRVRTNHDVNNAYLVDVDTNGTRLRLGKIVSGSFTLLASQTVSAAAGTWYCFRLEAIGTTIRCKFWAKSASEPSSWTLSATDTSITAAGYVQVVAATNGVGQVVWFDNISVRGASGGNKVYVPTGQRVSPLYDLTSAVGVFGVARIFWTATTPPGTSVTVETAVNGGSWSTCTNGGRVPGVTEGASATSIRIRITLATSDSQVTPSVADCMVRFVGLDPALVEVTINGESCTIDNGRLEVWGYARVAGGALTEDWATASFAAHATWFAHSLATVPVSVSYDGAAIHDAEVTVNDHELDEAGPVGRFDAWADAPDWARGSATGTYNVLEYFTNYTERVGYYYVEPGPDAMADGWFMVGHYVRTDGAAAGVAGEVHRLDGAAAGSVLGWHRLDSTAAGVAQGWLRVDSVAAGLPASRVIMSLAGAAVAGVPTVSTGGAAAIIYGVQRRTHIEIRSITEATAAFMAALGVTRGQH